MSEHSSCSCRDLAEKLLLFKDGDLDEMDTEVLREHLHLCPHCLDLLHSYDEVIEVLHRLEPANLPPGLLDRLRRSME
jgi:anti-sigma factor (TIGR02949 family)